MENFDTLMDSILKQPSLHARWLNTLAYLEHIGSRKIIKSQDSTQLDLIQLQHIAEEARHAFFMKNLCEKHFPQTCPNFEPQFLLGKTAPSQYFQALDSYVEQALEDQNAASSLLNYLYVTWLIEKRAMQVYAIYSNYLKKYQQAFQITSLILEEDNHLKKTEAWLAKQDPHWSQNCPRFQQKETELFESFRSAMEQSVAQSLAAA